MRPLAKQTREALFQVQPLSRLQHSDCMRTQQQCSCHMSQTGNSCNSMDAFTPATVLRAITVRCRTQTGNREFAMQTHSLGNHHPYAGNGTSTECQLEEVGVIHHQRTQQHGSQSQCWMLSCLLSCLHTNLRASADARPSSGHGHASTTESAQKACRHVNLTDHAAQWQSGRKAT